MKRFLFIPFFFAASCGTQQHIIVRNDYLTVERYASFYADTPDPRLICPEIGQMLTVYWNLADIYDFYERIILRATIRFGNLEQIQLYVPAEKIHGSFQFKLVDSEFWYKQGIVTYKIDVLGDNRVIDTWKHQLWVELIEFNQPPVEEDNISKEGGLEDAKEIP